MPVAATGIQKQVIWPMDRCGDPKMRELAFTLSHVALWPRRYMLYKARATINSQTFFDAQFDVNCHVDRRVSRLSR
jgi:hypothetical protein